MQEETNSQNIHSGNDAGFIIIPVTQPTTISDEDYKSSSHSREETGPDSLEDKLSKGEMTVFNVASSSEETAQTIMKETGVTDHKAVRRVADCAAFWKSLGVETLIYLSSFGGTLTANGLIIRFTGLNPLLSSLVLGNVGVALSFNMNLIITNLLKPAKEDIPKEQKKRHDLLQKYAFLPISWLIGAGMSGATLTILRDPSFGTQQIVNAASALFVGPIMHGLKTGTRKCLGGSLDTDPDYPGVKKALETIYGADPNPDDKNRPYVWNTVVSTLQRAITISTGTLVLFYNNGFNVETYCIGGRDQLLNMTSSGNYTLTGSDVEQNCWGGGTTYVFRELGVSATYAVGMMVVEPVMRWALDKVFDYFRAPAANESGDERSGVEMRVEDVTDKDV